MTRDPHGPLVCLARQDAPQVGDFVYRYDPASGMTSVVADNFNKFNGLAFSPDESSLTAAWSRIARVGSPASAMGGG